MSVRPLPFPGAAHAPDDVLPAPLASAPTGVSRRDLLLGAAAGAGVGLGLAAVGAAGTGGLRRAAGRLGLAPTPAGAQAAPARGTYDPAPFSLGVASGDPLPDRVILWTRLVPLPLQPAEAQGLAPLEDVEWEVATDDTFATVVARGVVVANATLAHSVHVDAAGLAPGTRYSYRFRALGVTSPVGHTRTAPPDGADNGAIRFASGNCQALGSGQYPAWRGVAEDADLDFVVHLGDYTYESSTTDSVATKRRIYEEYRGDPHLRAAHGEHPWFVTWDDHEVANDYSGAPASLSAAGLKARGAGWQVWYEHMPVRLFPGGTLPDLRIHKRHRWGRLLDLHVLDLRQHRSAQNLAGGTMLGAAQKAWLKAGLAEADPGWRAIANSIMFSKLEQPFSTPQARSYYFTDQWDGFVPERLELTTHIADRGIEDVVFITGDWHSAFVMDVTRDFSQAPNPVTNPTVATELVAHSISSSAYDAATNQRLALEFSVNNPHIVDFEGNGYGYDLYELTPQTWTTRQRVVATRADPQAAISTLASFVIERGRAGAVRA